jgi:hypothetical protein
MFQSSLLHRPAVMLLVLWLVEVHRQQKVLPQELLRQQLVLPAAAGPVPWAILGALLW